MPDPRSRTLDSSSEGHRGGFAVRARSHPIIQPLKPLLRRGRDAAGAVAAFALRTLSPYQLRGCDKLHLGSGGRRLPGWANIDITGLRNIIWDLRKPLPLPPGSIRYVYSEHFIEHVSRDQALRLLRNCGHLLAESGVVRISTPNLRQLVADYLAGKPLPLQFEGWSPATPCALLNEGMRLWGHQFVYDEEELVLLLREAGYGDIKRVGWGESEHAELRGLETRPFHGDLIFEARLRCP